MKVKIDGHDFDVYVSKRKHKKYDVYENDKYILSFGDNRYAHYFDKFGYYKKLNHNDKDRRNSFLKRTENHNSNNIYSANYWARNYLW